MGITRNFYIHIPFCHQKCPYCKFALTPVFNDTKKRRYIAYLKNEIETYFLGIKNTSTSLSGKTKTLYFGGGTPSILRLDEIKDLLLSFPDVADGEVTFESNPEDINEAYIGGMIDLGINRISLGVQSLNDGTLQAIHRSNKDSIFHAIASIENAIASSKKQVSFNIDFILGLPFSKQGETLHAIELLHKKYRSITHTSVYMLEEGHYPNDWKKISINENEMETEYSQICEYFDSIGWHHYEISNWAKPGHECVHNLGYWNHENYRGFGLGSTSYIEGRRYENSASFHGYYTGKIGGDEILDDRAFSLEQTIYGLRTFSLPTQDFRKEVIENLKNKGFIKIISGKIILTPAGIFRENFILGELISNMGQ